MKTYEIKNEPININGNIIPKWNIYYYENDKQQTKEFWSYIGESEPIEGQKLRIGYEKK